MNLLSTKAARIAKMVHLTARDNRNRVQALNRRWLNRSLRPNTPWVQKWWYPADRSLTR